MFQLSGFYHSNMQQQALPCHHTLRFKVEGCALSLQLTPAAQFGNGRQQGEGDAAKGQGHRTQVGGWGLLEYSGLNHHLVELEMISPYGPIAVIP